MQKLLLIGISSIFLIVASCKKPPTYPDEPSLEYKSLTFGQDSFGNDETFTLTATFTDGDGDVGYHEEGNGAIFDSASSVYYYNFGITLSILRNGQWYDTTFIKGARLP